MSLVKIKINKQVKRTLYTTLTISVVTGISFFIFNQWIFVEGDFGPMKHPLQNSLLKVHAIAAFIMIFLFGGVSLNHSVNGWKIQQMRIQGICLVSVIGIQIITAYMLYYLSDKTIRDIVVYIHLIVGVSIPILLIQHIFKKTKHRKKKNAV